MEKPEKKKWCLSNMISKCLPNDFLHIIYLFESDFEKWDDGVKKKYDAWKKLDVGLDVHSCSIWQVPVNLRYVMRLGTSWARDLVS